MLPTRSAAPAALLALLLHVPPAQATPSHFTECVEPTAASASIIFPETATLDLDAQLHEGDEVAVFTPEGICAGVGVWSGDALALAVWEDDPLTDEVDGFTRGQDLAFRLWKSGSSREIGDAEALSVEFDSSYSVEGGYAHDAVFVVSSMRAEFPTRAEESGGLAFTLHQNYPNPFSRNTTIRYELSEPGPVRLELFDLAGRSVRTLVDEVLPAGAHTTALDGEGLAAGSYIYRIASEAGTDHHRLTLIR
jgi:hypothetical protein